jgi:hypothetical protein
MPLGFGIAGAVPAGRAGGLGAEERFVSGSEL